MREACCNCRFWENTLLDNGHGCCHRYPPVYMKKGFTPQFPATFDLDWCGEYQPKVAATEQPDVAAPNDADVAELVEVVMGFMRLTFHADTCPVKHDLTTKCNCGYGRVFSALEKFR